MAARHWLYFGCSVVAGVLAVGAGLIGVLEGLSALSGGVLASEEPVVVTMLGAAAEWVVAALGLGLIAVLFLVASVVSVLRNATLPRDDRYVAVVERLERRSPTLRQFGLSETFEPTAEDRRRQLREQYVAGEISETEFERRVADLMDETSSDERTRPNREFETDDRSR